MGDGRDWPTFYVGDSSENREQLTKKGHNDERLHDRNGDDKGDREGRGDREQTRGKRDHDQDRDHSRESEPGRERSAAYDKDGGRKPDRQSERDNGRGDTERGSSSPIGSFSPDHDPPLLSSEIQSSSFPALPHSSRSEIGESSPPGEDTAVYGPRSMDTD